MRLLYVSRTSGEHDSRFVQAWRSNGFDVDSLAVPADGDDGRALVAVQDALAESQPDLVQAGPLTEPAWTVTRCWGGPLIATSWGFDLMSEIRETGMRRKAVDVLGRADVVLVDNDAVRSEALTLGARAGTVTQFPWGLEERWHEARDRPVRLPPRVFLSTRRHEALYRVDETLRAFLVAARVEPEITLRIAGSGSMTADLRRTVEGSPDRDRVQFLGEVPAEQLPSVYRDADVYVTSSEVDGTSVSLLEAMASDLVVLAADIPGNREWVTGETGFVFSSGGIDELSALMVQVARPDAVTSVDLERRVRNAHHLVRARADWPAHVAAFPEIARRAMARSGAAR